MKKNILVSVFSILLLVMIGVVGTGCSRHKSSESSPASDSKKAKYYTCSMHQWVHSEKPGTCPVCGMNLVPVYEDADPSMPEDHPPMGVPESRPAVDSKSLQEKKILYYVDPMHPQFKSDKPGKSPDCGMDMVPVYEEAGASQSSSMNTSGRSTVRLSPEKQQLIGVKTEEVSLKPLLREIHTTGRVAFDPNLLVAQNEYLIALKSHPEESVISDLQNTLVKSSKLRLQLLGMSEESIRALSKSGKAQNGLILPQKGGEVWIYGSLFESDLPWVKVGTPVEVWIPGDAEPQQTTVESIDPGIDPMTRTAQVRLRVPNPSGALKPDMYLKLNIQSHAADALAIPSDAVLSTGNRKIAFVDQGNGKFEPRNVKLGRRGTGTVEVLSGVSAGERVVVGANFLIDSESQLKSALSNMGNSTAESHSH